MLEILRHAAGQDEVPITEATSQSARSGSLLTRPTRTIPPAIGTHHPPDGATSAATRITAILSPEASVNHSLIPPGPAVIP